MIKFLRLVTMATSPKKGLLSKRYLFNTRNQNDTETFNQYLDELRKLIKNCDFKDQEDDILRDRIVMGIKDNEIREQLLELTEEEYSLNDTIGYCRVATAAKQKSSLKKEKLTDRHILEGKNILYTYLNFIKNTF